MQEQELQKVEARPQAQTEIKSPQAQKEPKSPQAHKSPKNEG